MVNGRSRIHGGTWMTSCWLFRWCGWRYWLYFAILYYQKAMHKRRRHIVSGWIYGVVTSQGCHRGWWTVKGTSPRRSYLRLVKKSMVARSASGRMLHDTSWHPFVPTWYIIMFWDSLIRWQPSNRSPKHKAGLQSCMSGVRHGFGLDAVRLELTTGCVCRGGQDCLFFIEIKIVHTPSR